MADLSPSARCPFCEAAPGQAVTATATQAMDHAAHATPAHHEKHFALVDGECQCECPRCWRNEKCICQDCTAGRFHDHSQRVPRPSPNNGADEVRSDG